MLFENSGSEHGDAAELERFQFFQNDSYINDSIVPDGVLVLSRGDERERGVAPPGGLRRGRKRHPFGRTGVVRPPNLPIADSRSLRPNSPRFIELFEARDGTHERARAGLPHSHPDERLQPGFGFGFGIGTRSRSSQRSMVERRPNRKVRFGSFQHFPARRQRGRRIRKREEALQNGRQVRDGRRARRRVVR